MPQRACVLFNFFLHRALLICLTVVFVCSLFIMPNIGGEGLDLPFNVMVWAVVVLFIVATLIRGVINKQVYWAGLSFALLGVLLGWLVLGAVHTDWSRDAFIQTLFNFMVIVLFFWALFQYKLTQAQFSQLLLFFCLLGALQSLIAVVQVHDLYRVFYTLIPYEAFRLTGARPLGTFQQVNMLATFLAFTLVASLYLISSALFLRGARIVKIGLFLCVLLSAYVLFLSGSRAGLLALWVGASVMCLARYRGLWRHRTFFLTWLLMLSLGFFLSVFYSGRADGVALLAQKTAQLSEGIRWSLYQQSWALFLESPLTGLGIGNFPSLFGEHVLAHHLEPLQVSYWTHPHNELLYWMLQSGGGALVLALLFMGYFFYRLFQSRREFSLAILALLMPFIIQSQLSYPFSLSSLHLFIPLVLMYVATRQYVSGYSFSMPAWGQISAIILLCAVAVVVVLSAWHSLKSIKELYIFENSLFYTQFQTKEEIANQRYLQHATYNLLYREKAISAMNMMIKKAIKSNNQYDLNQFSAWAENRGGKISQQSLESLAKVYWAQGKFSQVDAVLERLLRGYGVVLTRDRLQQEVEAIKTEADLRHD